MSSSSMEPDWQVPSLSHDTGVRMEQHPTWPKPGADWFSVIFFLNWNKVV